MQNHSQINRRRFLQTTGVAALAGVALPVLAAPAPTSESLVKTLYDTLDAKQRKAVCFPWDYVADNHKVELNARNRSGRLRQKAE